MSEANEQEQDACASCVGGLAKAEHIARNPSFCEGEYDVKPVQIL